MRTIVSLGLLASCLMAPSAVFAQTAPATAATADQDGEAPSLFDSTWRQVQIGARWTSIAGDPARWQRYEDQRNGLLFTNARYAKDWQGTGQSVRVTADNVGWRDQRYSGEFARPGRFKVTGLWDQVPQFYSTDTRTPYTSGGDGVLVLDDGTQRSIQNGLTNLRAYIPIAGAFELRERRDIGVATFAATPTPNLDLTTTFRTQRHVGDLPWGASFGFANDVEVPLPYNSRTNDLTVGAEWTNQRNMLRVAYDGSWFQNHDSTLVWDSPLRLDDSATAPGRGRMALWPSNMAHTVSLGGYAKFARRTQLTGFVSYGVWSNDEPLLPFTINTALPTLTLPRQTAQAEAHVFSTNLNLVSRPATDWRMSARLRQYGYDNQTPHTAIPQFINYDTSIATSATGGPEPFAHSRTTLSTDATWTGLSPLALAVGYTRNHNGYDFRIFDSSNEDVVTLTADAVGTQWATFRAQYEMSDRRGSGLQDDLLVEIGEQPSLRHFDLANRSRKRFTGQADFLPHEWWMISASAGAGTDDFDDSALGLQEAAFRVASAGVDFQPPSGLGAGGTYTYERYTGLQRSRSATPGAQAEDPLRDWSTNSSERVHYFSVYLTPPRIGPDTEVRLTYDYAYSRSRYVYGLVADSPLPEPAQLPVAYNKLQDLRVDVRHRLSRRLAATAFYQYEPFRIYDFAMDQSVIDGIVQPSSLVMGYVYRPYTAHSAVVGLLYFW